MYKLTEKRKKAPKRGARITLAVTIVVTIFVAAILLAIRGAPRVPNTSPFGRLLVSPYHQEGQKNKHELLLVDVESGQIRQLKSDEFLRRHLTVSPDRKQLLYCALRNDMQRIDKMDADGSNEVQLVVKAGGGNCMNPSWSPNGTHIVYLGDGLSVMNADGSNKVRLIPDGVSPSAPGWSPDGTRIVFVKFAEKGNGSINVINVDGSNLTRLTYDGYSSNPQWSPDGTRIVFSYRNNQSSGHLHLVNPDGSNRVSLVTTGDNQQALWSPDGTRLVYASNRDGKFDIYVFDLRTSVETRLTHTGMSRYPVWSPDGKYVAFLRPVGISRDTPDIVIINVDTLQELPEIEVNADTNFAMQWVN
jgi:Tol biopolymer transport system component